jgi:hypothetical protein
MRNRYLATSPKPVRWLSLPILVVIALGSGCAGEANELPAGTRPSPDTTPASTGQSE